MTIGKETLKKELIKILELNSPDYPKDSTHLLLKIAERLAVLDFDKISAEWDEEYKTFLIDLYYGDRFIYEIDAPLGHKENDYFPTTLFRDGDIFVNSERSIDEMISFAQHFQIPIKEIKSKNQQEETN